MNDRDDPDDFLAEIDGLEFDGPSLETMGAEIGERFVRSGFVTRVLKISRRTLGRYVEDGRLSAFQDGRGGARGSEGYYWFKLSDVLALAIRQAPRRVKPSLQAPAKEGEFVGS